eukprot:Em0023g100a
MARDGGGGFTLVDFSVPTRDLPVSHPVAEAPLCGDCHTQELCFFDPLCGGCQDLLLDSKTTIAELFAVMRQWIPQTQRNLPSLTREILRRGANVNDRDSLTDLSLLHYACKSGAAGIGNETAASNLVNSLLQKGADVEMRCRWTNMNSLHYAVYFDVAQVADLLATHAPALVQSTCSEFNGGNALHIAAANLSLQSVRVLLEHKANASLKDLAGKLPYECVPTDVPVKLKNTALEMVTLLKDAAEKSIENMQTANITIVMSSKSQAAAKPKPPDTLQSKEQAGSSRLLPSKALLPPSNKPSVPSPKPRISRAPPKPPTPVLTPCVEVTTASPVPSDVAASSQGSSGVVGGEVTLATLGLKIGDSVLVDATSAKPKQGTIRFYGPTEFSQGQWAGVDLEDDTGKNDGSSGGIRYFTCKPKHGLFVQLNRISKPPPAKAASRKKALDKRDSIETTNKAIESHSQVSMNTELKVGDRVIVSGNKQGILKFAGTVKFAPGFWLGVELDLPQGSCDGSRYGVEYFKCKPSHGLFSLPSKVKSLSISQSVANSNRPPAIEDTSVAQSVAEKPPVASDSTDSASPLVDTTAHISSAARKKFTAPTPSGRKGGEGMGTTPSGRVERVWGLHLQEGWRGYGDYTFRKGGEGMGTTPSGRVERVWGLHLQEGWRGYGDYTFRKVGEGMGLHLQEGWRGYGDYTFRKGGEGMGTTPSGRLERVWGLHLQEGWRGYGDYTFRKVGEGMEITPSGRLERVWGLHLQEGWRGYGDYTFRKVGEGMGITPSGRLERVWRLHLQEGWRGYGDCTLHLQEGWRGYGDYTFRKVGEGMEIAPYTFRKVGEGYGDYTLHLQEGWKGYGDYTFRKVGEGMGTTPSGRWRGYGDYTFRKGGEVWGLHLQEGWRGYGDHLQEGWRGYGDYTFRKVGEGMEIAPSGRLERVWRLPPYTFRKVGEGYGDYLTPSGRLESYGDTPYTFRKVGEGMEITPSGRKVGGGMEITPYTFRKVEGYGDYTFRKVGERVWDYTFRKVERVWGLHLQEGWRGYGATPSGRLRVWGLHLQEGRLERVWDYTFRKVGEGYGDYTFRKGWRGYGDSPSGRLEREGWKGMEITPSGRLERVWDPYTFRKVGEGMEIAPSGRLERGMGITPYTFRKVGEGYGDYTLHLQEGWKAYGDYTLHLQEVGEGMEITPSGRLERVWGLHLQEGWRGYGDYTFRKVGEGMGTTPSGTVERSMEITPSGRLERVWRLHLQEGWRGYGDYTFRKVGEGMGTTPSGRVERGMGITPSGRLERVWGLHLQEGWRGYGDYTFRKVGEGYGDYTFRKVGEGMGITPSGGWRGYGDYTFRKVGEGMEITPSGRTLSHAKPTATASVNSQHSETVLKIGSSVFVAGEVGDCQVHWNNKLC